MEIDTRDNLLLVVWVVHCILVSALSTQIPIFSSGDLDGLGIGEQTRQSSCELLRQSTTGCFTELGIRNRAVVSLFWDFRRPKGLLCDPKTGRKLLFGQK